VAKKSLIAREVKRERLVRNQTEKRAQLNQIVSSVDASYEDKMSAQAQLQRLSPNGSKVRIQRRCQLCGRPHAVYRKFSLCRICLRNALMNGDVPGGRKSSW